MKITLKIIYSSFFFVLFLLLTCTCFDFRILNLPKVQKYNEKEIEQQVNDTTTRINDLSSHLFKQCPFLFGPYQFSCSMVRKDFILNSETTLSETLKNITNYLNETISFPLHADTVFLVDIHVERNISRKECGQVLQIELSPKLSSSSQFIQLFLRFIGSGSRDDGGPQGEIECGNEPFFSFSLTSSKCTRLVQFQNFRLKSLQLFGEELVFRNVNFDSGVNIYENNIVLWNVSGEMPIGKIVSEESRWRQLLLVQCELLANSLNYLEKVTSLWVFETTFRLENVLQFVNIGDLILEQVKFIPSTYDSRMLKSPFVTLRFIKFLGMKYLYLEGFSMKTVMSIEYSVNVLMSHTFISDNYVDSQDFCMNVILAKGLNQLHILNSYFYNNVAKHGSCFEVSGVTSLMISSSSFQNNTVYNSPLYIGKYVDTYYSYLRIQNTLFKDNYSSVKSGGVSIERMTTESGNNLSVEIYACTFFSNYGQLGGAIYSVSMVAITNGVFYWNTAKQQGGAIFTLDGLSIRNSAFVNNSVIGSDDKIVSYCSGKDCIGNGGAIAFVVEDQDDSYLLLKRNVFEHNLAIRGGAISMGMSNECYIEGNYFRSGRALFAGGAVFITSIQNNKTISSKDTKIIIDRNAFENNVGLVYGDDMSSIVVRVSWRYEIDGKQHVIDSGGVIKLYPGQVFSLIPIAFDCFDEYISELKEKSTLTISNNDDRFQLEKNVNSFSDMYISVINQTTIYGSQKLTLSCVFSATNSDISLLTEPCPANTILKPANYGKSLNFICQKQPSYDSVIAVAVTVTIVTLTLALGFISISTYLCVKMIRKVKYWMRRDRAEKDIEKRLLENEINSMEDHTLQTAINSNSSSAAQSKKKHTPSFIISIDQIFPEKKIGEGGSGVVYLGKWHHHPVAIKCLKIDDISSSDEIEKEAAMLCRLRHPNIVQFYGVSITQHKQYLVVEYLEKGSLEKYINDMKRQEISVTFSQKLKLLIDIACGMVYLHSLKIIHRDLKPANILLDLNSKAKVCDFGIARIMENTAHTTTLYAGTLFYLAPELLQSEHDEKHKITTSVDVFSFSIIMWQLFFEESPYINSKSPKLQHFQLCNSNEHVANTPGIVKRSSEQPHFTPFGVLTRVLKGERPCIPWQSSSSSSSLSPPPSSMENDEKSEVMVEWLEEYMPEFSNYSSHHRVHVETLVADYVELMKACWSENYQDRPNFETILGCLMILKQHMEGIVMDGEEFDLLDDGSIQLTSNNKAVTDIYRILHDN